MREPRLRNIRKGDALRPSDLSGEPESAINIGAKSFVEPLHPNIPAPEYTAIGVEPISPAENAMLTAFEALPNADAQRIWFADKVDKTRQILNSARRPDGSLPDNFFLQFVQTRDSIGRVLQILANDEQNAGMVRASRGREAWVGEEIQAVWTALNAMGRIDSLGNDTENGTRKNIATIRQCVVDSGLNHKHVEYLLRRAETVRGSGLTCANALEALDRVGVDGNYAIARTPAQFGTTPDRVYILDAANDLYWLSGRANEMGAPGSSDRTSVLNRILSPDISLLGFLTRSGASAWSQSQVGLVSAGTADYFWETRFPARDDLNVRTPNTYRTWRFTAAGLRGTPYATKDITAYYDDLAKTADFAKVPFTWFNKMAGWVQAAEFLINQENKNMLTHLNPDQKSHVVRNFIDIGIRFAYKKRPGLFATTEERAEMIPRNPGMPKDELNRRFFPTDDKNLWNTWVRKFSGSLTGPDLAYLDNTYCSARGRQEILEKFGNAAGIGVGAVATGLGKAKDALNVKA